ncbi:hypothetical protein FKP32DRAFT_1686352 [Trametes sanguinea]|nr:hypothetical protein FKP32DRAFT_1686352 [Trametes sanguinea]
MAPTPLPLNVLHVLLQYISPPSQLTQPLPPHLLSKPLLQRHHFLRLTPDQPDEYLCWPSNPERKAHIIDLLESRPRSLDDDEPTAYPIQYSFDGEDFYAHVDLSDYGGEGPRVILQWDESGEWKFHNIDLMPFPPGSRSALEDILVPPAPPKLAAQPTFSAAAYTSSYENELPQDDSDDDDYWNAYGSTDIGDSHYSSAVPASAKDAASSEDAYWAQYASVQGTADSTIPSPIPQGRRKPLPFSLDSERDVTSPVPLPVPVRVPSEDTYAEPLPIPPSMMPRPRSNSRWDPASPTALAKLLASITPRESASPSPAPDAAFDIDDESSSPTIGGSDDSELSSSPGLGLSGVGAAVAAAIIAENEAIAQARDGSSTLLIGTSGVDGPVGLGLQDGRDEDEADLQATLEGVWKMWRKSRRAAAGPGLRDDNEAKEIWASRSKPSCAEGEATGRSPRVHAEPSYTLLTPTTTTAHPIVDELAMDDESVNTVSDYAVWKSLLEQQTALFEKTFSKNAELEARVEELERELSVWKEAFKTADGDRKVLNKTVLKLERNLGALKEDNPLILCLIDGDGNIFSADLIKQGQAGGRQAAALLTKGLTDYLASIDPADASAPASRGQVWLTIYCNKSGLVETLTGNAVCTVEEFEAFVLGFNQSSPLFSIVDVGNGKEAADSKIKECLRVFTRFPQTSKVFFGGAHDNGYTSTLNLLQNEGLLDKVVLLKGYKDLAHEINSLNLPELEIDGIFITKKLYTNGTKKAAAAAAAAAAAVTKPVSKPASLNSVTSSPKSVNSPKPGKQPALQQVQEAEKARSKAGTPVTNGKGTPGKKPRALDPTQPLHKQKPPPCNFHYLAKCHNGDRCRYEHHYILTPEQITELRVNAKRWPCPAINNGHQCALGDNCIMNHFCPKGPKCAFRKQGKCKFIGKHMHDVPSSQRSSQDFSALSPSIMGSALSQPLSEHALSPLASPFAEPNPFRVPIHLMDFDEQREENIRRNRALLQALGLEHNELKTTKKPKRKSAPSKKRRAPPENDASDTEHEDEERPQKLAKVQNESGETTGLRRSARNQGKALNYNEDGAHAVAAARALPRVITASAERAGMKGSPRDVSKRVHDPKTYGAIPGVPVGSWWETRQACSADAIHAPWVAGISAGPQGAYSIALSGGYEDDVDLGEAFTYTGSGGRDLKGTKDKPKNLMGPGNLQLRTAPQSCDQTFDNQFNRALKKSCETKKPVRVIRGYKLDSVYAPAEGYRYDGLYTVEKAWMEPGLNPDGFLVCKFALKRIPGQAPLQYGDDDDNEEEEEAEAASEASVKDETQADDEDTAPTESDTAVAPEADEDSSEDRKGS